MSNENGRLLLANLLSDYPGEMRTWGETPDEEAISEARSLLADADAQRARADAAEQECARLRAERDVATTDASHLRCEVDAIRDAAFRDHDVPPPPRDGRIHVLAVLVETMRRGSAEDALALAGAMADRAAARAEAADLRAQLDEASRSIRDLVRNIPRD